MADRQPLMVIDVPNADGINEATAWISRDGEVFRVTWTDYVANDWTESYTTLGAALARVALLVDCGANNFNTFFLQDETEWALAWSGLSAESLSAIPKML